MLVVTVLIAFAPLLQSASTLMRGRAFDNRPLEENAVYNDHLLFDSSARSLLDCVATCYLAKCCVRVTYTGMRNTAGRCRGHSTQKFPSEFGTSVASTTSYVWTGLREVTGDPENLALNKVATESSVYTPAYKAVDGDFSTNQMSYACTQTLRIPGEVSWWQVDLGDDADGFDVVSIIITNRGDCCSWRLRDFDVHIFSQDPATNSSATGTLCSHYDGPMGAGVTEELVCCNGPIRGRYVRVTNTPNEYLTLCEVQVMAVPAI